MNFVFEKKSDIYFHVRHKLFARPCMHHAIEILFLKKGSLTLNIDETAYKVYAGDIAVIFPDLIHSIPEYEDTEGYLLIVPMDILKPYGNTLSLKRPVFPIIRGPDADTEVLSALFDLYFKEFETADNAYKISFARTIVGKALSYLYFEDAVIRHDEKIEEALSYIHDHYAENPSRTKIARVLGLNENYVSHLFCEKLHCSFHQYIRSIQLQNAAEMLINSDFSINEIAESNGFKSMRSFNRNFISKYEMTPREYRRRAVKT